MKWAKVTELQSSLEFVRGGIIFKWRIKRLWIHLAALQWDSDPRVLAEAWFRCFTAVADAGGAVTQQGRDGVDLFKGLYQKWFIQD